MTTVALLGEFNPDFPPHPATDAAIRHSVAALGIGLQSEWVSTAAIDRQLFSRYSGIWVAPGSPYRNLDNVLWAIRYAREHGVPCFGTCGGFQHMVLEYARHVLGFADAQHIEYAPDAPNLFIAGPGCVLAGRKMDLTFAEGSKARAIYGAEHATEQYYCNFGVNPEKVASLQRGPLRITGSDADGEIRVIEIPDHPFFLGTLFVPQSRSTAGRPHPLVTAFLAAVAQAPPGGRGGRVPGTPSGGVSPATAEHYVWGAGCDAWHLVKGKSLSVIFERMPGGTEEAAHRHQRAQQFFYVLKGRLVIQVGPDAISVASGEGLEILPGVIHQVRNPARAPAEFLVISAPPSHGDREDIAHPTP